MLGLAQLAHIFMKEIGNPKSILSLSLNRNTVFLFFPQCIPSIRRLYFPMAYLIHKRVRSFVNIYMINIYVEINSFVLLQTIGNKGFGPKKIGYQVELIKSRTYKPMLVTSMKHIIIHNKANMYAEILMVKRLLAPFTHNIGNTCDEDVGIGSTRTKLFTTQLYMKLAQDKYSTIKPEDKCSNLNERCNDANISIGKNLLVLGRRFHSSGHV